MTITPPSERLEVVLHAVVGRVEVIGLRRILRGEGVDALETGADPLGLAADANGGLARADELAQAGVGEAQPLGLEEELPAYA